MSQNNQLDEGLAVRRALVAEDDVRIRSLIENLLLQRGYEVQAVGDGREAVEAFAKEFFPLVVLDWMLPGKSGLEVCEAIRALPRGPYATLLIETARFDPADQEAALRAGADDYLAKPFSVELLKLRLSVAEKRAQEKLGFLHAARDRDATAKRFEALVEAIPDIVFVLDAQGRFTYVNDMVRQVGYTPAGLVGRTLGSLLQPEDAARFRRAEGVPLLAGTEAPARRAPKFYDERRTGERSTRELELRLRARGAETEGPEAERTVEISASGLWSYDERGTRQELFGTIGTMRDVTEKKNAEDALFRSEARLRTALEAISDGVWDRNLRTGECYYSATWARMIGYEPGEIEPTIEAWRSRIHAEDLSLVEEAMEAHLAGRTAQYHIEFRLRHKNGQWLWIFSRGKAVEWDENGTPVRIVGMHTDVSEQKKTEEQLRQAQKLEAIGQLAGGIAHDFNNQLAGIMGFADLLRRQCGAESPQVRPLEMILSSAERASELTRQLLAFARKGARRSMPLDLHCVVREVLALLSHTLDKSIAVETELAGEPLVVQGDPTQLQSAILNIAINARDAMPGGGTLSFRSRRVKLDAAACRRRSPEARPGLYAVLSIADTGAGMEEEVKRHIFEPFFTTKEEGRGTGMGLAAVYGTVKSHKGWIEVDTAPGAGAEFRLWLPGALEEAGPSEPAAREEIPSAADACLLVVDDEEVVREMARLALEGLGYRVVTCGGGAEAVNRYRAEPGRFDLVLLDLAMPEMDGAAVFHSIRAGDPSARVLLSSGQAPETAAAALLDAGALGLVEKPFRISELARRVAEALCAPQG